MTAPVRLPTAAQIQRAVRAMTALGYTVVGVRALPGPAVEVLTATPAAPSPAPDAALKWTNRL